MIKRSLFILGRQPAIGRAELESLFGSDHLEPVGPTAIASDVAIDQINFGRLGSSIRLARPITTFASTSWPEITAQLCTLLPELLDHLPLEGKVKIGISAFNVRVQPKHLLRTGLELKKAARQAGRSARVVPNKEIELNSAQVLHNGLTRELGIELICVSDGTQTHIAQTVAVQDIDAYTARDRGRPKRDAFVGMLPPKLAQTLVNLAAGPLLPSLQTPVLDPFCGTGVLLQEALLMGYNAYGTDIEPRMIDYSRANLAWLATHSTHVSAPAEALPLEVGDATDHQWTKPFSVVACEGYLGRPLNSWPNPEKLQEIMGACNVIAQKFLANIAAQIPAGTRLCIALPAWQAPNGRIHHLKMLDQLEVLGYNRVSFVWASEQEMVYRRPDQFVARELLVITRK